jgi:taurine dioxygenase
MTISIKSLDAALGAAISGVDLSKPVAQADIDAIEGTWRRRLVVVFHGQNLSDPQLLAFSRRFGDLDPPGPNPYGEPFNKQHPEINVISNVVEAGKPIGNLGDGEAVWHADMTYVDVPPKAAMLYSLEVPPSGGNTYFADMFAAYETLPADLEKAAKGKVAVHDASRNSAGMLRKGCPRNRGCPPSVGAHRSAHRPQGAVSRPPTEQLRGRPRGGSERGLARRAVGPRHPVAVRHVSRMEGRRPPNVEQSLGAASARPVRP